LWLILRIEFFFEIFMKFSCNISLKFSRRQNFMKSYITSSTASQVSCWTCTDSTLDWSRRATGRLRAVSGWFRTAPDGSGRLL